MLSRKVIMVFTSLLVGFLINDISHASNPKLHGWDENFFMVDRKIHNFSAKEVLELEKKCKANPNDLSIRMKLVGYYFYKKHQLKSVASLHEKHVLWMIENHPDAEFLSPAYLTLFPQYDGKTCDEAKGIWIDQIEKYKNNTNVLFNASEFFRWANKDLARQLLEKGRQLEPENPTWPESLAELYLIMPYKIKPEDKISLKNKSIEQYEKAFRLTKNPGDKLRLLLEISDAAFELNDMGKAKGSAEEMLKEADSLEGKQFWMYGSVIHFGNVNLGRVALKKGDLKRADEYLINAGKTPGSKWIELYSGPDFTLAGELLDKGEKDTVLQYLQLCSEFWKKDKGLLKKWIALIGKGEKPNFYERWQDAGKIKATTRKWAAIKERVRFVSLSEAEQELKKGNKSILYDFSAEWCGPCKILKKEVFGEKKTADWIDRSFIPVMVLDRKQEEGKNSTEVEALQRKYHVEAFPTLAVQFPNGEFKTLVGYGSADKIRQFLEDGLAEFQKMVK